MVLHLYNVYRDTKKYWIFSAVKLKAILDLWELDFLYLNISWLKLGLHHQKSEEKNLYTSFRSDKIQNLRKNVKFYFCSLTKRQTWKINFSVPGRKDKHSLFIVWMANAKY